MWTPARMTDEQCSRHNAQIAEDSAKRRLARMELKARLLDCVFFIAIGYLIARLLAAIGS